MGGPLWCTNGKASFTTEIARSTEAIIFLNIIKSLKKKRKNAQSAFLHSDF